MIIINTWQLRKLRFREVKRRVSRQSGFIPKVFKLYAIHLVVKEGKQRNIVIRRGEPLFHISDTWENYKYFFDLFPNIEIDYIPKCISCIFLFSANML